MEKENLNLNQERKNNWRSAFFLFIRISGWIAIPVVLALFVGKWLDDRFNTAPLIFLSLTGIAFVVSLFGIVRESRKTMSEIINSEFANKK